MIALGLTVSSTAAAQEPAADADPGGIGIRIAEAPVAAREDPRARIYIVDHLAPGAVIERRVEVSNTTAADHQVTLYSSAATIVDGVFVGADGSAPNDLSRWTSVAPGAVDLASGETQTAIVTVAVPDDAAPGEQYAVVWAEVRSSPASGGVSQVSRVGLRLYVSVGAGAPPAPDFEVVALTPARSHAGAPMLTAAVRNTGGRALDVTGTLALANGPGGLSAGPFPAELNTTLAVGDTADITIKLDERLPAGPWDATLALKSGATERTGEATITFPDAGEAPSVAAGAAPGRPWLLFGSTAAAATAALVGLLRVRRARRARRDRRARRAHRARQPTAAPGSSSTSVDTHLLLPRPGELG